MALRYDNNAKGQISGAVTAGAVTLTMATGHGARFVGASVAVPRKIVVWEASAFDDPQDAANDPTAKQEIMHQTARSGDNLTVVRAQEGTIGIDMTDTSKDWLVMGTLTAVAVGRIVELENVVGHGAAGDGVTDDTAAVIAAFDAVVDGGTVYFPVGSYDLASWPVAGKNYAKRFRVVGEEESILIGPAGSTFLDVEEEVTIDGLHFSGWDVVLDLDSIATTIERIRARNCRSSGAVSFIEWDTPGASAVITDLEIDGNEVINCTGHAINLQGVATAYRIHDNQIDGGTAGILIGSETVADEDDWRRVLVRGNVVRNIASAAVKAGITVFGREVNVSGNIVDGVTGAPSDHFGIWVTARFAIVDNNIVLGVAGATLNYGIAVLGSDRADTVAAVAGWHQMIRGNSIDMGGGEFGIFSGCEDVVISGNVVEECILSGIQTQVENVQNERLLILGNIVKGGGGSSDGISLQNASNHVQVKDNAIEDHAIAIHYRPNAASVQAYAPDDIQIVGNSLIDGAVGTHGIRLNPNTTNVTGTHSFIQIRNNYVQSMATRWCEFTAGVYDVVEISGNKRNGNGGANAVLYTVTPTNLLEQNDGDGTAVFAIGDSDWDKTHLVMGIYHFWVDATGDLRIKSSAPASDLDGTVIGTQT